MKTTAIVTGGLRGLGKAMALGLLWAGYRVVAVGHIEADIEPLLAEAGPDRERLHALALDLTDPAACDRLIASGAARWGHAGILVNNAGLTFTFSDPRKFIEGPRKFWTLDDATVQAVLDTNIMIADRLTRRLVPRMIEAGWGRIVNVTTKLDTMDRAGSAPYGPSKAALEMATAIWAKDLAGTGVTVNIVNPGAGADTPGMAAEMRARPDANLLRPEAMVPPLLYVVSPAADTVQGWRFDDIAWDPALDPREAARRGGRRAGFLLHPLESPPEGSSA